MPGWFNRPMSYSSVSKLRETVSVPQPGRKEGQGRRVVLLVSEIKPAAAKATADMPVTLLIKVCATSKASMLGKKDWRSIAKYLLLDRAGNVLVVVLCGCGAGRIP